MVGHQVLVLSIEVRVLVPQLEKKHPYGCFSRESWGKESPGDFPSRTRSLIELDYERSDIICLVIRDRVLDRQQQTLLYFKNERLHLLQVS